MLDEEEMPLVVFVKAYDEFAIKAFEENALDYLLKPVDGERLARAVQRIKRQVGETEKPVLPLPPLKRIPCHST